MHAFAEAHVWKPGQPRGAHLPRPPLYGVRGLDSGCQASVTSALPVSHRQWMVDSQHYFYLRITINHAIKVTLSFTISISSVLVFWYFSIVDDTCYCLFLNYN